MFLAYRFIISSPRHMLLGRGGKGELAFLAGVQGCLSGPAMGHIIYCQLAAARIIPPLYIQLGAGVAFVVLGVLLILGKF